MIGRLLVVMAVWITSVEDAHETDPGDRGAYEAASKEAGRDARSHIRLALWCEAHGMTAERVKHLAAAVMYDPSDALARGLMGLVVVHGKWERPEEVNRELSDDPGQKALMEEYLRRRAKAAEKTEDQSKLAAWCDQNGLKEQAIAHYHVVVRLDAKREAAWKHLGYKRVGGRWVRPEQLEAERREAADQGRANKHWRPVLERWRSGLASRDPRRRADDEASLAQVTDPRAVPMIWAVFVARGRPDDQMIAVRMLGQVDSPGSSRAMAMLSVFGQSAEARRAAAEILRHRDPRDFLGALIGMVRDPLKYEIRPGAQRNSPGELFVDGRRYNVRRRYIIENDSNQTFERITQFAPRLFAPWVPFDPYGARNWSLAAQGMMWNTGPMATVATPGAPGPGLQAALSHAPQTGGAASRVAAAVHSGPQQLTAGGEAMSAPALAAQRDLLIAQQIMAFEQIAEMSRQQLRNDVQTIENYNADVRRVNGLVVPMLNYLTGVDKGDSGEDWQAWWSDRRGYAYSSPDPSNKPTYTDIVLNPFILEHHACFEAGTRVHTLDGPRPIESIWVGDQVLSQDVKTGKLAFTPVVAVYHNPPVATFRINLEGQSIVATGIHRFWKAGKGWTMARDLKPGDILRTLGGVATVKSVEANKTQPVFNLQVADGESYFVGDAVVLAHDNSTINAVPEPFDAVGPLTAGSLSTPSGPRRSMLGR
jgi:hypothetical protein